MEKIRIKVDGQITEENTISLRHLGELCGNFQRAIGRVYLDVKKGNVQKWQRLSPKDANEADFYLSSISPGCIIIEILQDKPFARTISSKLCDIISTAFELVNQDFENAHFSAREFVENTISRIENGYTEPKNYQDMFENFPNNLSENYVFPATIKYLSEAFKGIRTSETRGDSITVEFEGIENKKFVFTREHARRLYRLAYEKIFLAPVLYHIKIVEMNSANYTGIIENMDSNGTKQRLIFLGEVDFNELLPYFGAREHGGHEVQIIASPRVEGGSLDLRRGDILYVGISR